MTNNDFLYLYFKLDGRAKRGYYYKPTEAAAINKVFIEQKLREKNISLYEVTNFIIKER